MNINIYTNTKMNINIYMFISQYISNKNIYIWINNKDNLEEMEGCDIIQNGIYKNHMIQNNVN